MASGGSGVADAAWLEPPNDGADAWIKDEVKEEYDPSWYEDVVGNDAPMAAEAQTQHEWGDDAPMAAAAQTQGEHEWVEIPVADGDDWGQGDEWPSQHYVAKQKTWNGWQQKHPWKPVKKDRDTWSSSGSSSSGGRYVKGGFVDYHGNFHP
ncbi:unnamed protein product, partial [Symbiodinium sp. CCMP2456]